MRRRTKTASRGTAFAASISDGAAGAQAVTGSFSYSGQDCLVDQSTASKVVARDMEADGRAVHADHPR